MLFILQAGNFIIEYCGEVISWKEAKRRSQAYEIQGGNVEIRVLKRGAYITSDARFNIFCVLMQVSGMHL